MKVSRKFLPILAAIALLAIALPSITHAQSALVLPSGQVWLLQAFGDTNRPAPVLDGTMVTADFDSVGFLIGNGGCNDYFGSYSATSNTIRVDELGSTKMYCGEPINVQEQNYFNALTGAAAWSREGNNLYILYNVGGIEGRMIFGASGGTPTPPIAPTPPPSPGKIWVLSSMGSVNNPQPVIPGTTIAMTFPGNNLVFGYGGCNAFQGSSATTQTDAGTDLSISNLATTLKHCPTPDGVMQQESAFFGSLSAVETYTLQVDQLKLYYNNHTSVLNFVAQPS